MATPKVMQGWLLKQGAVGVTRLKWRRRWFCQDRGRLLYFAGREEARNATQALGSVALDELLQVIVVSQRDLAFDLLTERRQFHFRAESVDSFSEWIDFLSAQTVASRTELLPIEGWFRKKGLVNKAMKNRYFRQVGSQVYYFKSKQHAMNVEMARGKIDLSKVSSVSGHAISSTEGLITVNTVNGRIYHLEMPLADFDRTLKGFAGFSPLVFISQWPQHWNARLLIHSCALIRNSPDCLNSFMGTLLSRTNIFEEGRAENALLLLDQWFGLLAGESLPSNLDVSQLVQCARVVLDTSLAMVWTVFLELVYRRFELLCQNEEIAAVLIEGCLLRDSFEMSFLSWSVTIRWTFYQVVAAAVAERPEWKSLVMRKVEDLDVSSPYLDLETFKQVLSEFCNRDPNEPFPPLQPLPPKPSIEKFGIVRKEISGGSSFKD